MTFRRRLRRRLNVLCTFDLRPASVDNHLVFYTAHQFSLFIIKFHHTVFGKSFLLYCDLRILLDIKIFSMGSHPCYIFGVFLESYIQKYFTKFTVKHTCTQVSSIRNRSEKFHDNKKVAVNTNTDSSAEATAEIPISVFPNGR